MTMLRLIFATLVAMSVSAHAGYEPDRLNRLYLRFASMFSVETAVGYERRLTEAFALTIGMQGGVHFLDTASTQVRHAGIELGTPFYFGEVEEPHQYYVAPCLGLIYGFADARPELLKRFSTTPHFVAARLFFLAGYRYTFLFPMTIDIGAGIDVITLATPLNPSSSFAFFFPLPFVQLGVGYRF